MVMGFVASPGWNNWDIYADNFEGLKIVHWKNLETFQKDGKIQFQVWLEGFQLVKAISMGDGGILHHVQKNKAYYKRLLL